MLTKQGLIQKTKLIASNPPLVYFKLNNENCLIAKHGLSFLADVAPGMQVIVHGIYNRRGQFIVSQYQVVGKTKIMLDFELSPYPSRKKGKITHAG